LVSTGVLEVSGELFAADLPALLAQEPKRATAAKRTKCVLNMKVILMNVECRYHSENYTRLFGDGSLQQLWINYLPILWYNLCPVSFMAKAGPIVIIEDDSDDREVFEEILKELNVPNKTIWFTKCDDAFNYLKTTTDQPFLIFSDVNLPIQNGIEFKRQLDNDEQLRKKSIPFVFYSTSVAQKLVNEAYTKMTVQGFFQKANSYEEIRDNIKLILDYWSVCKHPNT
jgi:CheY-like chemotaxis protein